MAKTIKNKKRRKLNLKVALIGIFVIGILAGTMLLVWYKQGRDPQKYIEQAETALLNKDYRAAEQAYGTAHTFSNQIERRKK